MRFRPIHAAFVALCLTLSSITSATIQPVNGLLIYSAPDYGSTNNGVTINAAGESHGIVGHVRIQNAGTGKVISAAGSGKIAWQLTTVTWASAGTKVRIGIEDVDTTTGLEDGTFDVYKELTQGTDTLTSNTFRVDTMGSGTKTLSDGDLISIVAEMTVRNGADSVQVVSTLVGGTVPSTAFGFPYGTIDNAALAKSTSQAIYAILKFDDGTYGWIEGAPVAHVLTATAQAYNSGSTPDEYIGTFVPAMKMQVCGIGIALSNIATTDNFEVILYSDPLGTPSATVTVTADPDVVGGASGTSSTHLYRIAATTLTAGATYGVAARPTTANNINVHFMDMSAGSSGIAAFAKALLPLGSLKFASRTNQSGAFSEVSTDDIPLIAIDVCGLDDGTGGGQKGYAVQ